MLVKEMISEWNKLKIYENPFGPPISEKYLTDDIYDKSKSHSPIPFRDRIQNGSLSQGLIWIKKAEETNFVIFSDIFNECFRTNTLCISNYLYKVIKILENKKISEEVIRGYIARAIRSFASFLREIALKDIVCDYFTSQGLDFEIIEDEHVKEDTKNKTDIFLKIKKGNFIYDYRIWSFQTTEKGLENTARRLKNPHDGINILLPLNIGKKENHININTWYLYNPKLAFKMLDSLKDKNEDFQSFSESLSKDFSILNDPHKFILGTYKH